MTRADDQAFTLLSIALNVVELTWDTLEAADDAAYRARAPRARRAWDEIRQAWLELSELDAEREVADDSPDAPETPPISLVERRRDGDKPRSSKPNGGEGP